MWKPFQHGPLERVTAIWAFFLVVGFWTPCARADSDRVAPVPGYGAWDIVLRQDPDAEGILYSAGLEVVYADLSHTADGHLARCFLHVEAHDNGNAILVTLHDYQGRYQQTLCEIDTSGLGAMPQCVKLDPRQEKLWCSYTVGDNADDRFYSVAWDPGLSTYPQTATFEFQLNGNWEIAWSSDQALWDNGDGPGQGGRAFFAATGGRANPHAIWVRHADGFQKVVQIGGYGSGFAFDNEGNLWSGAVTYSGSAEPLFMWTAEQVDAAADSGGSIVLQKVGDPGPPDWGPTVRLALPSTDGGAYFVPSDITSDPDGNVYVSCNSPFTTLEVAHTLVVVTNDGKAPWPNQQDMHTLADAIGAGADKGFRALCYDGVSSLDAGGAPLAPFDMAAGNRLYVDMDFGMGGHDPDAVVGLSTDDDADQDTIPDAFDNCRQTANADQADADDDGIGDACEGDCDGSGKVDALDLSCVAEAYGIPGGVPAALWPADLDGDGDVDGNDLAGFAQNVSGGL